MDNFWHFENVNLFKLLCPHKYEAYAQDHNFSNYKKSDYIYFEEDSANKMYLINEGKVKIGYYTEDGNEIIKAFFNEGRNFWRESHSGN